MENVTFTERELRIKSWLGLPTSVVTLFLGLAFGSNLWVSLGIWVLGWYLYALLWWKLYQRYMLDKLYKERAKFYGLLVGYQLALIGALIIYAL